MTHAWYDEDGSRGIGGIKGGWDDETGLFYSSLALENAVPSTNPYNTVASNFSGCSTHWLMLKTIQNKASSEALVVQYSKHRIDANRWIDFVKIMFQLSALLKELIRSDAQPMDVDPYVPVPIKHLQFLEHLKILLLSTQSHTIDRVEFQAAIASQWRFLWPWLKASLAAILVYGRNIEHPADVCHRIALCSHPVLSLIALIMETISPSTATFTKRVFEAPGFNKLVAASWITSIRRPRDSDNARLILRMMIAMGDDRIIFDEALDVFGDELKTSFTRITGATPARFCKECITDEFLGIDKDVQRKCDTEEPCLEGNEKLSTSQPCYIDGSLMTPPHVCAVSVKFGA
ncbi:hypothetical protein F5879DRAFT_994064 [Lentinula edodes]|nr:hypothetical protein F5879DRAFT_994064 [Lentinula edodes]